MTQTHSNSVLMAKKAAGQAAAYLIQDGMLVGLGTGSTAAFFIEALAKRCQEGLKITAIATSQQSSYQARTLGIPLKASEACLRLDITVDGADEIDPYKNMIKGGGGALLREKLLAQSSKEMLVIVDETKLVNDLGHHSLPVEIAPFIYLSTLERLKDAYYHGTLRLNQQKEIFITDNGNYIVDIHLTHPIKDPQKEHNHLKSLTGVIETGLFFHLAKRVVIGYENGLVKIQM